MDPRCPEVLRAGGAGRFWARLPPSVAGTDRDQIREPPPDTLQLLFPQHFSRVISVFTAKLDVITLQIRRKRNSEHKTL